MDVVKKIEAQGTPGGKPSGKIVIVDSGELEAPATVEDAPSEL